MSGALAGIRVIDLTNFVFGPVASQMLGDMGADVIKVEPPAGDPTRLIGKSKNPGMGSFFLNLNRNKQSIVLNLKQTQSMAALHKLLTTADVLVHNMRQSALNKLELGYADLAKKYPQLIYASAQGFGANGQYFDRPAYDDIIQGLSGLVDINEQMSGQRMYVPMLFADKLCGTLLYSAITTALFHRERTGQGQEVAVPMLESTIAFTLLDHMADAVFAPMEGEMPPDLGYRRVFGSHHRPLRTKDEPLCLIANTDAQWQRLLSLLGMPELMQEPRFKTIGSRIKHINALYTIVERQLLTKTRAEWLACFEGADIPASPAHKLNDLRGDPHLRESNFFKMIAHSSEGMLIMPDITTRYSASPGMIRRAPPLLGEHSLEVLRPLGFRDDEIQQFMA